MPKIIETQGERFPDGFFIEQRILWRKARVIWADTLEIYVFPQLLNDIGKKQKTRLRIKYRKEMGRYVCIAARQSTV